MNNPICLSCGNDSMEIYPGVVTVYHCTRCKRVFLSRSDTEPELIPAPDFLQPTQSPAPVRQSGWTLTEMLLAIALVFCLIVVFAFAAQTYFESLKTPILTNGVYELPQLTCISAPVKVELGVKGQAPLVSVYPQVEGQDQWQIAPETEAKLNDNQDQLYLWMHCDNANATPEMYIRTFPMPQDGMQVTIRR